MRIRYALTGKQFIEKSIQGLGDESGLWNRYPCLPWERGADKDGYGQFKMPGDRLQTKAHRYAWTCVNGEIPNGIWILHHCDNPRCFRPVHLFAGTHADNMRDMAQKGRASCIAAKRPEVMPRGERHGNAKLTDEAVREIRRSYAAGEGSQSKIAARFGVSQGLVGFVVAGKIWRHVA